MYLTIKQQLNHPTKPQYLSLRGLSHTAKNLTNEAIYNIRQYYFEEGEYLSYPKNYVLLKGSDNYKLLKYGCYGKKKSNVVSLQTLYSRGEVNTPLRIRIF